MSLLNSFSIEKREHNMDFGSFNEKNKDNTIKSLHNFLDEVKGTKIPVADGIGKFTGTNTGFLKNKTL